MNNIDHIRNKKWDFVIIGTGISGGTIGYALAKSGKSVLFLERGFSRISLGQDLIAGSFPESDPEFLKNVSKTLNRALRCSQTITDISNKKHKIEFTPILGEGVGGSSSIYGAAFERFFPEDFKPTQYYSRYLDASVVDWPIQYNDLEKYYAQAEDLYNVYGGVDPLRTQFQSTSLKKRKLSPAGERIFQHWKRKNLNPYLLPVAHPPHYDSTCPGCQACLCISSEKKGSYEACIKEAVNKYGASCLDQCEVTSLEHTEIKVRKVHCIYKGESVFFEGSIIILAAGAVFSPALLLRSKSSYFPNGLSNSSGMVGKNLCRHFFDLAMIKINPFDENGYYEKELALNDFYFSGDDKLGTVQSLGNPPHFLSAYHELHSERKNRPFYFKIYLFFMKFFGRRFYEKIMREHVCLAVIMEDIPYEDNRIEIDENGKLLLHYILRDEAKIRLRKFRNLVLNSLRPYKFQLHCQGENNQRLAHASGTCRMGDVPLDSVVDRNCKSHDLNNLYIIDSSFFPSSSGINPALTLAANALRVADILIENLKNVQR